MEVCSEHNIYRENPYISKYHFIILSIYSINSTKLSFDKCHICEVLIPWHCISVTSNGAWLVWHPLVFPSSLQWDYISWSEELLHAVW